MRRLTSAGGNEGLDFEAYETDVSKVEDWDRLKDQVQKTFGGEGKEVPDFLMLNAGVGVRGTWGEGDYFQKVSIWI